MKSKTVNLPNGNKADKYETVEDMMEGMEREIPTGSLGWLKMQSKILREKNITYKNISGKPLPGFLRIERKLNREIAKREQYAGSTPTPNAVVRNSFYNSKNLSDIVGGSLIPSYSGGDPILAQEYDAILSKREAGYILDAIGVYVRDYFLGNSENMKLNADGDYYVVSDTFDNFCKKANIHGYDRRIVKEALFPEEGKLGLLERVPFVIPDNKKQYSLKMRFISARRILTEKRKNKLQNEGDTVHAFEMDIHAGLYGFLEEREKILSGGKVELLEGYQYIPIAMNSKIDRVIHHYTQEAEKLSGSDLEEAHYMGHVLDYLKARPVEYFRRQIFYTLDKWNRSLSVRQKPMTITWKELADKDLVPKHSKRRDRRELSMEVLARLMLDFAKEDDAYKGCYLVYLTSAKDTIIIPVKEYESEQDMINDARL